MPLLSTAQVKEQYGYSRDTLLRMEQQGKLHPKRVGSGHRRYEKDELDRAMTVQTAAATEVAVVPSFSELGVAGVKKWGGSIYEERLKELRGRSGKIIYHDMRVNDPVVAAVFFAIENTLKQAIWVVSPASESAADKEAAEFLETCLFYDMNSSWSEVLDQILIFLEQGFSLMELVYKRRLGKKPPMYTSNPASSLYTDGRIGWRKWAPRPAESLAEGDEWIMDDKGGIHGCNQQPETYGGDVYKIPIERLLLFRTTTAPANSPEAMPIHRPMYLSWYYSMNMQEIEGIGVERDLAGIPIVYLGEGCSLSGARSDMELAKELVVNLRNDEQAGIVVPHPKMTNDGRGMLVELLSASGGRQHDVDAIIGRYNKLKAMSVLSQFIMLGTERVGSYALSKHQGDLFNLACNAWLNNIADIINKHAIPRLFSYNVFPEITGYPQIKPSSAGLPNLADVAEYVNVLANQELIRPDQELERHLRMLARLPQYKGNDEADGSSTNMRAYTSSTKMGNTALLLRQVLLSIQNMKKLGLDTTEESALIKPLVDDLRRGIYGGAIPKEDMDALNDETFNDAVF